MKTPGIAIRTGALTPHRDLTALPQTLSCGRFSRNRSGRVGVFTQTRKRPKGDAVYIPIGLVVLILIIILLIWLL
jgi:hypothetical protein